MDDGVTKNAARRWLLIPVLFAPVFMVILDIMIVNVTAPSLRADLGATESQVQWVVAAYLLTYAISLITGGRLGDVFGRRRMFMIGLAGFTLTSALCALAPTPEALIGARLLQGFTGAAMWPQVLSIIQVEFPPEERPRAFGIQGMVIGLGAISGQIIGGGLIALDLFDLGWRWVFLVNVPVGLIALFAAGRLIPESRSETARHLDLAGVGLATLALTLVLYPTIEGRELGWPAWGFIALAAAVPVGALFVAVERRIAAAGRAPLAELHLFQNRGFRIGIISLLVLYGFISFFFVLPIYLQDGLGLSAIDSGLAFTPMAAVFAFFSIAAPRLGGGLPEYLPQIGTTTAAVGLLLVIVAVQATSETAVSAWLILAMVPVGAGMGMAVPTIINLVLRRVPGPDAGAAAGMLTTSQQIGNALGIAIIGTIFFSDLGSATSVAAYGDAFSLAIGVQVVLALTASALLSRARERAPRPEPAPAHAEPAGEGA
jgi:EmrB/QacA subfamily drug resistance transporter